MKFGRNLPQFTVPEWSASYIKYKALKKLIKSAAEEIKGGQELDLAGFFYSLDRNVEDVDYFYNKKYAEYVRRLKLLEDRYGYSMEGRHRLEPEDRHDLREALLDLRYHLRRLQWYGEVNRRGFVKITKKLDKKVGAQSQKRYLETKVDPAPFASNARVNKAQERINSWMAIIADQSKADEKLADDSSSTHSSLSLKRGPSRPYLNLPPSVLTAVDEALRKDDTHVFLELLETLKAAADEVGDAFYPKVVKTLIQRSILHRARAALSLLLERVDTLEEDDEINRRNCLHRLVISIGREQSTNDSEPQASMVLDFPPETTRYITPAAPPTLQPPRSVVKEIHMPQQLGRDDPTVSYLQYLLDELRPHQRAALIAKDLSGRTPLHYAAQYGFKVVCEVIIEHLKEWGMFDVSEGIDGPLWQDNDGWAPLHLSVVGGHPKTTGYLLDAENWKDPTQDNGHIRKQVSKSNAVLALATKANFVDIVHLLVNAGVDINYQDEQGETALHFAARFGHDECARILLEGTEHQKADTELAENTYSWTPLFIACVDGSLKVAELLVAAGADLDRFDASGWTPKEHAALRGHLAIARCLAEVSPGAPIPEPESTTSSSSANRTPSPAGSSPPGSSLTERRSNVPGPTSGSSGLRSTEPIKTFGHRYLTDETMILVSLGTMDMRKPLVTVNLDRIPMENAHATQLDTALSMVITASGAHGEPEVIDLPVQDNISTEPIVFHTTDASKVRLLFDLVPTYSGSKDQVVGRGVALLSSIRPTVGSQRINLKGDSTVPIIAANTLDVIGSVTFNFLVITPFTHPNMSITGNQTYWRTLSSTMVIGHRGLGKNMAGRNSLQLGENTIQSFIAAANLGASYVEFDVQLTKDHVPVIYHDFLVSETGTDAPVHTLTLEQFLELGKGRRRYVLPDSVDIHRSGTSPRPRSMSVGGFEYDPAELTEKIKYTRDFKKKGFKGNTRGEHIQAPFATLEELFKKIPKSVGFNIELKYPMLHESEEEEMDTYAVELNSFVDTVLTKVYDLGGGRDVLFSSFNPDICLLCAFKQPSIPVLFLTDAGASPVGDIRASSLQEAIRFASRWNLLGIVSQAEPLVLAPRLVRIVKESGLVCVSYGVLNNDAVNVDVSSFLSFLTLSPSDFPSPLQYQVAQGIDAVIVDSVLGITNGLIQRQNRGERTPGPSPNPHPISDRAASSLADAMKETSLNQADKKSLLRTDAEPPAVV
ncbi:Glycerophosphoryl diester phosphodiesterase [Penicillium lagena]|uniref:Glycerophosphoryl diester phosphodiesterase n=1 Tax=Penicillium lagena TaxID=94218 RepID=UPI00253FCFB9|nr:Glycerophosphoryl diester phosphodiesterase [Penicillium lagena]KAJ5620434.1 Glycerophosphoryl diester phosphodiesterase [Penicillium lagena]